MLAVEFHAARPPPGLDPLLVLLRRISLGVVLEWRHDSWKWFEASLAPLQVRLQLQRWCASMLQILELQMISLDKSALQHFFLEGGGGGCKTSLFPVTGRSEPLWYPSSSLSFNSTPWCFEHIDLSGIHFLACWVSIWKWFWHDLYPHFPILLRWWGGFLSLWPNKSDSCKRGEKKKKWDLKFPSLLSGGAQLQCILFSIRVVQLQIWELQVERRAKTRQKWLIFIGT